MLTGRPPQLEVVLRHPPVLAETPPPMPHPWALFSVRKLLVEDRSNKALTLARWVSLPGEDSLADRLDHH